MDMEDLITEVLERLPQALALAHAALVYEFPEPVFESIKAGMLDSARRLNEMPRN